MNRPGQPQQRPPNLTPNPALASQFRPTYPSYSLPPRNVLQSGGGYVPTVQPTSHRTTAQPSQLPPLTPQPTPGFNPPRGQSSYGFGAALGQHQSSGLLQQQQQQQQQQQLSSQQQLQQAQTNGTATMMSSLLGQTGSLGTTPSVSSLSEVGLDPNDFPALGSTPSNSTPSGGNAAPGSGSATSYASQAGTGVMLGAGGASVIGGSTTASQTRDFTAEDFPALGGQGQSGQSRDVVANHKLPQGQIRQNLLASHGPTMQQSTPGLLNLSGTQSRNVHPGFQQPTPDAEKQHQRERNLQGNFPLKMGQQPWGSPTIVSVNQSQQIIGGNGTFAQNQTTHTPNPVTNSSAHSSSTPAPQTSNGLNTGESHSTANGNPPTLNNATSTTSSTTTHLPFPQTPAQQVLVSAADRWGLLSLIAMMKNASSDADHALSSIGTDLGSMGLDMNFNGNLYSTFITPWADQSAARSVEPEFHLPACYLSVQAPPPGPAKAAMFSDETLFFMFYSSPRDALQEVAAQELWNRNWRYHKELRVWITKESGTAPSSKVQGGMGEQGQYTFWDPENWAKERKEMTVLYADLEEKSTPAFAHGAGLVLASQAPSVQPQLGAALPQSQLQPRGSFQLGMAGL